MSDPTKSLQVPIAVSGRHVHLSKVHCDALFGPEHTLTCKHPVTQPGQFACHDTVAVIGPRGAFERVAIVAPLRPETQVELSRSDAIHLGVNPPVRESGHLENSPGLTLRGPRGTVQLDHGAIVALRHLHATPEDARRLGIRSGDSIAVKVSGPRAVLFDNVVVRVDPRFQLDVHLDTDEANAAGVDRGGTGTIVR
jgi:propanediol utilization protein